MSFDPKKPGDPDYPKPVNGSIFGRVYVKANCSNPIGLESYHFRETAARIINSRSSRQHVF